MDKAGNYEIRETWGIGGNSYYWTIEKDKPEVTIIQGPAGVMSTTSAYFEWISKGDSSKTQKCYVILDKGSPEEVSLTDLGDGVYKGNKSYTDLEKGRHLFTVTVYYSGEEDKADTAFRSWVIRERVGRVDCPVPPHKFWFWQEGD